MRNTRHSIVAANIRCKPVLATIMYCAAVKEEYVLIIIYTRSVYVWVQYVYTAQKYFDSQFKEGSSGKLKLAMQRVVYYRLTIREDI